jgi:hypothetical protein
VAPTPPIDPSISGSSSHYECDLTVAEVSTLIDTLERIAEHGSVSADDAEFIAQALIAAARRARERQVQRQNGGES